jgi:hypothetical protein
MCPGDFVSARALNRQYRANYFDSAGQRIQSSRTRPAGPFPFAEGAWLFDDELRSNYGHEIYELRLVDPGCLVPSETMVFTNQEGRARDAERYAAWLSEGRLAPPVMVVEALNGEWRITDGHRRWRAAQLAERKVRAWFGPLVPTRQFSAIDGAPIRAGLTYELAVISALERGRTVPDGVAAYVAHQVQECAGLAVRWARLQQDATTWSDEKEGRIHV